MTTNRRARIVTPAAFLALIVAISLGGASVPAAAQSMGVVEFTARVAPTDGSPEPVRQLRFFLLRKSLDDIRAEAMQGQPGPDFDKFVNGLKLSDQLKNWIKQHHTLQLFGTNFAKGLTPDEIVDVPEFYAAYMFCNAGLERIGFPTPKYKEKDRVAQPEKYQQLKSDYQDAVRKFIAKVPESVQNIESGLRDVNFTRQWDELVAEYDRRLAATTLELAQTRYIAARAETNLDGRGAFSGIPPGDYWIGMLNTQAIAGDVRLRWDVPVTVHAGQATQVDLNNFNAAKSRSIASRSNY